MQAPEYSPYYRWISCCISILYIQIISTIVRMLNDFVLLVNVTDM